jgi:uncharacterized membrane protein
MKQIILIISLIILSSPVFAANLECGGTEPFWGATVKGGLVTYLDPNLDKAIKLKVTSINQAAGYSLNNIMVIKTKFTRLTVVEGKCSDGMSDETYSHNAVFEKDGIVLGGCCNLK